MSAPALPKLTDLKAAGKPPRVPPWWEWTCWAIFIAGVATVLAGLATLGLEDWRELGWPRWATFAVLCVNFPAAAVNTFLAAKCFGRREKALLAWILSRINFAGSSEKTTKVEESKDERVSGKGALRISETVAIKLGPSKPGHPISTGESRRSRAVFPLTKGSPLMNRDRCC